ncbi:hypothetical protein C1886_02890 [Pseudomonas sp. FW300-N1A1]|nr:hypothetical protein C1886_02890 [Pseudomonas sp. FW300-N1A1]
MHPPWRASLFVLGCRAAPKTVVEFVLKDRSRFVGCASRTSASKLARHGYLTRFKPFLTEQHCAKCGLFCAFKRERSGSVAKEQAAVADRSGPDKAMVVFQKVLGELIRGLLRPNADRPAGASSLATGHVLATPGRRAAYRRRHRS